MEPSRDTLRTSVLDAALQLGLENPTIAGLLFNPVLEEEEEPSWNPGLTTSESDESATSPSLPFTPSSSNGNSMPSPAIRFQDSPRFHEDLRSSTPTIPFVIPSQPSSLNPAHKLRKHPPPKAPSLPPPTDQGYETDSQKKSKEKKIKAKEGKEREKEEKLKEKGEKLREKEEKLKEKEEKKERGRADKEKEPKKGGFMGKFRMKSRERKTAMRDSESTEGSGSSISTLPPLPLSISELPIALRFAQIGRSSEDITPTAAPTQQIPSPVRERAPTSPWSRSPDHSPSSSTSEAAPSDKFTPTPNLDRRQTPPSPQRILREAPDRAPSPAPLDMTAINQYYYGNPVGRSGSASPDFTRDVSPSPYLAASPRSFSPFPASPRPISPSNYIVPTPQPSQSNFPSVPDPTRQREGRPIIQFVAPPPSPSPMHLRLPPSPRPSSPGGQISRPVSPGQNLRPLSPRQRPRPISPGHSRPISPSSLSPPPGPPPTYPPPPIPTETPDDLRFLSPSSAAQFIRPERSPARVSPFPVSPVRPPVQRGRTAPFPSKPALGRRPSVQDPRIILTKRLSFTDDQALDSQQLARKRSRKSMHRGGYGSDDEESRYSSYSAISSREPPQAPLDVAKERERLMGHQRLLDRVRTQRVI